MPKKESTIVNALLFSIYAAGGLLEMLIKNTDPYKWRARALYGKNYNSYRNGVNQLRRRGVVEVQNKNGKKFLKLTKKGELEVLLAKARMPKKDKWDGKWRLIIYDIPEGTKLQRDGFRELLKKNDFRKLQASVYISPQPLNREALVYLRQTGLMEYIRIIKVEEMDDDKNLRKKFGLS